MDVFEAIKSRRSIRKFKQEQIPEYALTDILNAGRLAPSAANRQSWRFVVVKDADLKHELALAANNQKFLEDAAVILVSVGDPNISRWYEKDVMIAVDHMTLAAASLGYGSCWIGAFDEPKVKQLLDIPKEKKVIVLLPIGVSDVDPEPTPRKTLSAIFFEEKWKNS